jgi:alginate O-acetyltransferase complex protein AlgI
MLFNSFIFFLFLGVVLPIFLVLRTKGQKNLFLVLASYFFYGYWDWRFCGLLLISTLADYLIGRAIHRSSHERSRKGLLALSLLVNLGILGFFKYFNFFAESFKHAFRMFGAELDYLHLHIILPVGISFYTFQTMSYSIDIYRRKIAPTRNLIDFALFVAFFPQLVAGPIERAANLLPQLSRRLHPSRLQIEKGVVLIVSGLFRKVMIGDAAGKYVDHFFGNVHLYRTDELLFALLLFSIQIYADFSGYSHIARGVAKLLGIELMKNFEQPYLAGNITEFWRRWHISLSSWLKDYLYVSMGGNRRGRLLTYRNLFITMLLGGLWHGASWNFVVWGGLHGLYLALHKLMLRGRRPVTANRKQKGFNAWSRFIAGILVTQLLVLITWLFFRSSSWDATLMFFQQVMLFETGAFTLQLFGITAGFVAIPLLVDVLEYRTGKHTFILQLANSPLRWGILAGAFVVTLIYMFISDPLPFIYFQF